ncbi:MAG TPA: glycosyltransferase N-terminal domain-containing protein, partial [Fimbriimonadaceae bacterium]|nr:glycosyltransferase N-terminal domain-containing protein [Fimbriimonadaceae bacterium]
MTILAPLWVPWMLLKARRRKEQPNWKERMGDLPIQRVKGAKRIWVHAVSVGEVVAALPILRETKRLLPGHELVLSVTTSSGHQTAREQAMELVDHLIYFPLDIPRFQLNAMQRVQPQVVAVMETELWMNFLWAAKTFDARTLLINGRISDRSFPRAMKLRPFYRALLRYLDRALMQTSTDRERILALGATEAEVLGNCKFDQAVEGLDADPDEWRAELGFEPSRPDGEVEDPAELSEENGVGMAGDVGKSSAPLPVIVVGSTRGDEEEDFVLDALEGVEAYVIHAPRHLERVPELVQKVRTRRGAVALRSRGEHGHYLILDTYGELSHVYSVADLVVVGGGFSNLGGQNILQPLAHGKPVLHGPHMQNFAAVADSAQQAGATVVCSTPDELRRSILELLEDRARRDVMGQSAAHVVKANLGASRRYAEAIAAAAKVFPQP